MRYYLVTDGVVEPVPCNCQGADWYNSILVRAHTEEEALLLEELFNRNKILPRAEMCQDCGLRHEYFASAGTPEADPHIGKPVVYRPAGRPAIKGIITSIAIGEGAVTLVGVRLYGSKADLNGSLPGGRTICDLTEIEIL